MKNRRKNIVRSITHNLNRFLSILVIVAIGSGFMAGLAATSPDMYETADAYIDSHNLYDIDLKSPLGFTKEDIDAVKAASSGDIVVGMNSMDMVVESGDSDYTVRLMSILDKNGTSEVNQIKLKEGRYPEDINECVIEIYGAKYGSGLLKVGDTLVVSKDNSSYDTISENMDGLEMTVVGISLSPMCLGLESDTTNVGSGTIGLNVYTLQEKFTSEKYTDIIVVLDEAKSMNTFSDEYSTYRDDCLDKVRETVDERMEIRKTDLTKEINDATDDLKAIRDILQPIDQTNKNLAESAEKGQKINEELLPLFTGTDVYDILKNISDNGDSSKTDRLSEIDSKIDELKTSAEDIQSVNCMVRTRDDLACYASYDSNVGKLAALSKVFPVFFFLVALLVALTTMTRLVEENRIQIGTLKALGFSNGNILSEYLVFSTLASVLGCLIGFTVGFRLFPFAINSAYSMMYYLPELNTKFRPDIALTVAPVTIGSILLATLFACWGEFRSCPAVLMVPKAPAAGKRILLERIGFLWKILPFSGKVTARNIFRYKKRFFMTVIGVSGCSALLLTGFGIRDSVSDIVEKQYTEINRYELTLAISTDADLQEDRELQDFLQNRDVISGYLLASSENGKLYSGSNSEKLTIYVPKEAENFDDYITLRNRKTGQTLSISSGVIVTEKLCEELGLKVGDEIKLENGDGKTASTTVAGITENYITSFAYMTKENYEKLFSSSVTYNHILCNVTEDNTQAENLTTNAMKSDNVIYAKASSALKKNFSDSIKSINGVIWVLIFAAGLLCAVVLYNLSNVNICERRKELATIRVLGFYQRETEKYIFREINILSFIGALAGLVLGYFLHAFVIKTVEVDKIMFGRDIYLPSYLYAVAITMLFTFLVNRLMSGHIRKVDMAAAMKAND